MPVCRDSEIRTPDLRAGYVQGHLEDLLFYCGYYPSPAVAAAIQKLLIII